MRYYFVFGFTFTTVSFLISSDYAYRIGTIDALMLEKEVEERGYSIVEKEIEEHSFDTLLEDSLSCEIIVHNPYIIKRVCAKKDDNELSKKVFYLLQNEKIFVLKQSILGCNMLNQKYQTNRVDYCTHCIETNKEKVVKLEARFFNKILLKVALESCKKTGQ